MKTKNEQKSKNTRESIYITLLIISIFSLIYFVSSTKKYPEVSQERLALDPTFGPDNAPITITEYGDYACEVCKDYHQSGIIDKLQDEYKGQIKFIWKDFPRVSHLSRPASEAAQCAFDQNKFWEYQQTLYDNYPRYNDDDLKSYAVELGLDMNSFNICFDEGLLTNKVLSSLKEGNKLGFSSPPSFTVNETKIIGPPSYNYLKNLIDEKLSNN